MKSSHFSYQKWIYRVKEQCFQFSGTDNVWCRVLSDPRHRPPPTQNLPTLQSGFSATVELLVYITPCTGFGCCMQAYMHRCTNERLLYWTQDSQVCAILSAADMQVATMSSLRLLSIRPTCRATSIANNVHNTSLLAWRGRMEKAVKELSATWYYV